MIAIDIRTPNLYVAPHCAESNGWPVYRGEEHIATFADEKEAREYVESIHLKEWRITMLPNHHHPGPGCSCDDCLYTTSRAMSVNNEYALAKHVPDIAARAVFETNYGQLRLTHEESQKVAELVGRLLRKRLAKARQDAAGFCMCEDCPPVGYPTDKTRCAPCPRREQ